MKNALFLSALSLAGLAAAQPSGHRRHQHLHEKRQVVVTDVSYVTASAPDVVVYVDADGESLSTSTVGGSGSGASTSATSVAQVVVQSTSSAAAAATTSAAAYSAPAYTSAAASSSSAASSSASSSAASSSSSISGLVGIAYSPYSGDSSEGNVGCKTAAQVAADFAMIPEGKYNLVRIYGTDCNQVENVIAAKPASMKIFAGVYDITQVASELAVITAAAEASSWDHFHTISIGNELINSNSATVSAVVGAISTARGILSGKFTGSIVTVDTTGAIEANPELCENSDYVAANAHPFFDATSEASNAGSWLLSSMQAVSAACGGKDTMITETGWPWAGDSNGVAVPSPANQQTAISAIESSVTSNYIMFTALNDLWKAPGYLSVEQSWGVYGNSAAS